MASLTFSLTCFPSSNFSKTSLRGFPRFPVTSVGNSGSMGTMICCKLAQRASLNMIRRIDLLTEILFVRDRFSQILCETYTIVFGFSASMSTTTPSPAQIQKMDRLCFEKNGFTRSIFWIVHCFGITSGAPLLSHWSHLVTSFEQFDRDLGLYASACGLTTCASSLYRCSIRKRCVYTILSYISTYLYILYMCTK